MAFEREPEESINGDRLKEYGKLHNLFGKIETLDEQVRDPLFVSLRAQIEQYREAAAIAFAEARLAYKQKYP